jgi:hypothetical protein
LVAKKEAVMRYQNGRCELALKLGLLLWLISFSLSVSAVAQVETTSRISGIVKDPSGAVVPGAAVTVKNENTGASRQSVTDSSGFYSIVSVLPGT